MTEQQTMTAPQQHGGPPAGTPAIVDVYIDPAGNDVNIWHEWRWQGGPSQGQGAVEVPGRNPSEPGTPIHFNLHDSTGRGFDFAGDAIWVLRSGCPDQQCQDPEIPTDQIQVSPNLLKVLDRNSVDCTLHYRLLFQDNGGKSASYDPEIRNGGTTSS